MTDQAPPRAALSSSQIRNRMALEFARSSGALVNGQTIISLGIVMLYATVCVMLIYRMTQEVPPENQNLLMVMFGGLTAAFTQVVNYHLGSSAGSARKDQIAAAAAPAPAAPPAPVPQPPSPEPVKPAPPQATAQPPKETL